MASSFSVAATAQDGVSVLTLDGFLDAHTAPQFEEAIQADRASGRRPMRVVGQMGWVPRGAPEPNALVAYEATVNEILNRGRTPTICVYDLSWLKASLMWVRWCSSPSRWLSRWRWPQPLG